MAFKYEEEKIKYTVPSKNRNYIPDFVLESGIVIEAKGKLDRQTKEKMLLVLEQNPDRDIRFLFMRDNKLSKTSKTRYSDWCNKRGITHAVSEHGEIPIEWLTAAPSSRVLTINISGKRKSKRSLDKTGD